MAAPGWQPHRPPATPAEIQPGQSVKFLEFEIKIGQGHRWRRGGRGGHPLDNEWRLHVDAGGVRGITIDLQPPPRTHLFDQRPVAYMRRNCLRTP